MPLYRVNESLVLAACFASAGRAYEKVRGEPALTVSRLADDDEVIQLAGTVRREARKHHKSAKPGSAPSRKPGPRGRRADQETRVLGSGTVQTGRARASEPNLSSSEPRPGIKISFPSRKVRQ